MIDNETLLDGLFVIIGTTALLATQDETLHQLIFRNIELQHGCHLVTALTEHLLQSLSLRNGAGETIEDNTGMILAKAVIDRGEDTDHQFVGNQLAVVDELLGCLTQLCTILNLCAQNITRRDMVQSVLLNELVALGALA